MAIINNPQTGNAPTVDQQDQTQQNNKNKQRGTGFTNIGRILQANQGVGQRIGQTIGGNISQQAQAVREGIESGREKFQAGQQSAAQQAGQNISRANTLAEQAKSFAAGTGQISEADKAAEVGQNLRNTQYTGPMGIEDADKLQSKAINTAALSRLAGGGASGQDLLLRNMVAGRGPYTRGQSSLDRLLLGKEGQQQIQAGRQAAAGLTGRTQNTLQSAQNLAQATQQDIESGKQAAIQGINQSALDIEEAGRQRAQQFTKDAQDLNAILSNTYKADTPEAKQRALDLISRMGEFGLQDKNLYAGNVNADPNMLQGTLSNLAGRIGFNFGEKYLTEQQKQAGQVLSQALADKQREEAFKKATFDTDVYKDQAEQEAFRGMDELAKYDTETANILKGFGSKAKQAEDAIAAQQAARAEKENAMKTALDQINKMRLMNMEGEANLDNYSYNPFGGGQDPFASKLYETNPEYRNLVNQYTTNRSLLDRMAMPGQMSYNDKNMGMLQSLANEASKYGFLAFADRGENDIDQRFRNLGLGATSTRSGDIRSSQQFNEAANRALGKFINLRDLLQNRINPAKEAEDINTLNDSTLTQK